MLDSRALAEAISAADFSDCAATVVGYGHMGREYVKALRALGIRRIRVCSRSEEPLVELRGAAGVEVVSGGVERLEGLIKEGELGIVATPPPLLVSATERLVQLGFRRLLIEKPISFWSDEIEHLAGELTGREVEAVCAFNRTAYPAFYEVCACAEREGGITSCTYAFTEMIRADWPERFPAEELARWGVSNSLHVVSMAHGLIGLPARWQGYRSGESRISWHSAGSVFVGSGISDQDIPFSYHADWGSTGRWSVEIHTPESSYLLCPMEKVQRRTEPLGPWREVPVVSFSSDIKAGILEQVAIFMGVLHVPTVRWDLRTTARLTAFGEQVFGYASWR